MKDGLILLIEDVNVQSVLMAKVSFWYYPWYVMIHKIIDGSTQDVWLILKPLSK